MPGVVRVARPVLAMQVLLVQHTRHEKLVLIVIITIVPGGKLVPDGLLQLPAANRHATQHGRQCKTPQREQAALPPATAGKPAQFKAAVHLN